MIFKALRPKAFPEDPQTLGEHLSKRRHELGLFQKEAAKQLGVSHGTLIGWELDRKTPMIGMWPRIIKFLNYYPFPEPQSLPERLVAVRRHLGICHRKAARELSVDEGTYRNWELGRHRPSQKLRSQIEAFVAANPWLACQGSTGLLEEAVRSDTDANGATATVPRESDR